MTDKEKVIIEYFTNNNKKAYYIDIRNAVGSEFNDEEDFDTTLLSLVNHYLIYENEKGDTLFILNE